MKAGIKIPAFLLFANGCNKIHAATGPGPATGEILGARCFSPHQRGKQLNRRDYPAV